MRRSRSFCAKPKRELRLQKSGAANALRPGRKRELVKDMISVWRVSERRTGRFMPAHCSTQQYKTTRSDQADLKKRIYRLYHEMGLQPRNKTPKRRVKAKLRDDRKDAAVVNETWAMDFVHDQLVTGRKLRILTVLDTLSRFSPVVDPRFSYKGEDVVQTLDQACKIFGYQKSIRADNVLYWKQ